MSAQAFEVVVARFREDLSWTDGLAWPCTVYNKGPAMERTGIRLENIGREAHTYLFHIATRYESLAEHTVFVQGDPHRHTRDLVQKVNSLPDSLGGMQKLAEGCWSLSDHVYVDEQYQLDRYGICPEKLHDALFEKRKSRFRHAHGAQYVVHASAIRNKPRRFFDQILNLCSWREKEPWALERIWPSIFDALDAHGHRISALLC